MLVRYVLMMRIVRIIVAALLICCIFGITTSCTDKESNLHVIGGIEEGYCNGAGPFSWNTSLDEALRTSNSVHTQNGEVDRLQFENVELWESTVTASFIFRDEKLVGITYNIQNDTDHSQFKRFLETLINAYGANVDELTPEMIQNDGDELYRALWTEEYSEDGKVISILLEKQTDGSFLFKLLPMT